MESYTAQQHPVSTSVPSYLGQQPQHILTGETHAGKTEIRAAQLPGPGGGGKGMYTSSILHGTIPEGEEKYGPTHEESLTQEYDVPAERIRLRTFSVGDSSDESLDRSPPNLSHTPGIKRRLMAEEGGIGYMRKRRNSTFGNFRRKDSR
jgi:hypothetical protein